MKKRSMIWDIPTRVFHWLFAGLFVATFLFAKVGEHTSAFAIHMILGMIMGLLIAFRLIWGFVGTRHSRFKSFLFSPLALIDYLKGAFTGSPRKWAGHNPGSAYAVYLMLLIPVFLIGTGLLMVQGGSSETFEEVHEVLGNLMLLVVGAHVAGIVWHTMRHKESIALSMINGRKEAEPSEAIASSRPWIGVALLASVALWAGALFKNYDFTTQQLTLPVLGSTLTLGEEEGEGKGGHHGEHRDHEGRHDD